MGKWKYVNWVVTLIVVTHMYWYFFVRYQASASLYIISSIAWILVGAIGYYIFVVRMRQTDQVRSQATTQAVRPKTTVRERPKVVFKKKDADEK